MSEGIAARYGAHYFDSARPFVYAGRSGDLYSYVAYRPEEANTVEAGDSVIVIIKDDDAAHWIPGPASSLPPGDMAVKLRGYSCGMKAATLRQNVNLPYINGCATRQVFPPERPGDPTLQQLTIPPHTSEQAHHIHATARVVFVYEGQGWSIVGQAGHTEETELTRGMVCTLDPMVPHHFRTEDQALTVLPVHVFSSVAQETAHPMRIGTREV